MGAEEVQINYLIRIERTNAGKSTTSRREGVGEGRGQGVGGSGGRGGVRACLVFRGNSFKAGKFRKFRADIVAMDFLKNLNRSYSIIGVFLPMCCVDTM